MKSKILLLLVLFPFIINAQREINRWQEKINPYIKETPAAVSEENGSSSVTSVLVNSSIYIYRVLISDQDGDNCPFYPSCSHFFVESVEQTNLLQGIFMFGDRFTRDMNIINRRSKYPIIKNKRLYDPPGLYSFGQNTVYPPK